MPSPDPTHSPPGSRTPPAAGRCLIVTALPLDDLQASRHGIYQRLRMLVTAMAHTGLSLDVVCSEGTRVPATDPQALARVAEGLQTHWGVSARVLGLTRSIKDARTPYLVQQLLGCLSQRWSPGMRAAVAGGQLTVLQRALDEKPSLVLAHRLRSMALLSACQGLPTTVFDMDDIEHVVHQRRMGLGQSTRERWLSRAELPALGRLERQAVRRAWKTLVCARDDAQLLADFCGVPNERVAVVPNGLPLPALAPEVKATAPVVLMVGIYSYEPNGEGARHFIDAIWPLVKRGRPDAEAWFVGASPESIGDADRMPEGVRLLGFVDDIEAIYAQASVVICPILTGGGTRVKLIEAALRAKPIVSTTLGAEGLGFTDGREARLCDTPERFAQACLELMADTAQATAQGAAARSFAQQHYDRDRIAEALAAQCRQQLAGG
jgi:glycosyltransferase involved in cell wall biosynthesis